MPLPTLYRKGYIVNENDESIFPDIVPIDYILKWFMDRRDNTDGIQCRVLILKASTGSGKSTTLPPSFYEQIRSDKFIACTQPRILNAISIPKTIVPYYESALIPLTLGVNIGYKTGFISRSLSKPGIIYMTTGVLYTQLSLLTDSEIIRKYSCIFIDEAHERSILMDMTLLLLKKFLFRNYYNPQCPYVVIMSATIDIKLFSQYFLGTSQVTNNPNIIIIKGETYPITEYFLHDDLPTQDMYHEVIANILDYHTTYINDESKYRDILVFVAGIANITKLKQMILNLNHSNTLCKTNMLYPVPVTGDTVKKNPGEIFSDIQKIKFNGKTPSRRVFIGTNVAETGITISTLGCVIDMGYYKSNEFNPVYECQLFINKPITQSMHIQRRGRVGREAPGVCYNIFSKHIFDNMMTQQFADIIKDDFTLDLLNIIAQSNTSLSKTDSIYNNLQSFSYETCNVLDIDFIETPALQNLNYALNKLFYLGALTYKMELTPMGYVMSRFRKMDIEHIVTLLWGYLYGVAITDLIHIIISLSVREMPHTRPSDFVDMYNDDFIAGIFYMDAFFKDLSLVDSAVEDLFILREEIINNLLILGLNPFANIDKQLTNQPYNQTSLQYVALLKKCIYEGFKLNIAKYNSKNQIYETRLGIETNVPPQLKSKPPTFIVYNALVLKKDMSIIRHVVDKYCILDNYVNVDYFFDMMFT